MIRVFEGKADRVPLPSFLRGLKPESLLDLSWTDPALGVQDSAWWPEDDQSPQLEEYERYGAETLTPDVDRKVVVVVREVEPWSEEEIADYRRSLVPASVTMRQARLALLHSNVLHLVDDAISALQEPDRSAAQIEWEYSQEVERDHPFVQMLAGALGLDEDDVNDLFLLADTL